MTYIRVKELEDQVEQLKVQVEQLKEQIQSLQQDSNKKQDDLLGRFDSLSAQMGQMKTVLLHRQEQVEQLKEQIQSLQQDSNKKQDDLLGRFDSLSAQMGQMKTVLLHRKQRQSPQMRIFVKKLSGEPLCLNVDGYDTIDTVKKKIEVTEEIPPAKQMLIFAGRQLGEDWMTLADCEVGKEATLHLVIKRSPRLMS